MRIKLLTIALGAVGVFIGVQELRLTSGAEVQAAEVTLAELEASGPGDNAHVIVGDFLLCTWGYVYEEKRGKWKGAWVPAVPLGGEYHQELLGMLDENGDFPEGVDMPMPKTIHTVFKLPDARGEGDVDNVADRETVQGMVINEIESLDSQEKRILSESYPGIDFDKCTIFEHGRKPKGMGTIAAFIGGGGLLALLGLFWTFGGMRKKETPAVEGMPPVQGNDTPQA